MIGVFLMPHQALSQRGNVDIDKLKISLTTPSDHLEEHLALKITEEASLKTGLKKVCSFGIEVKDENNKLIGGLSGYEFYGSLVIDVLWIDPLYRKKTIGSLLLKKVDALAKQRNIKFISVSTMEWWDCVHFYEKHGFKLEFIRDGFDNGYKQYHLKKTLLEPAS
ncbi:MAG: GNAT family N-acetyltransferase [Candidatus Paracaedibacteraceae bacterium]|nr:GNAT family N-acetyltransferase [Candidatus Paracaedibacteraceae bacterium]